MTYVSVEDSICNVHLLHILLVVSLVKVQFSERPDTMKLIQEVNNNWDGKFIYDGELIESMEI